MIHLQTFNIPTSALQYVDDGTLYAIDIVNKKIPACRKMKQACIRHLNDIERSQTDDYEYYYDPSYGDDVIKFISMLKNPSNITQGLEAARFQRFIIHMLYSWRTKKNGNRRYRRAYISMARKNGKSLLVATLGLYDFLYGKSPSMDRQITMSANNLDQAKISFKMIAGHLEHLQSKSKTLRKKIRINDTIIKNLDNKATIKALANGSKRLDGLNVRTAIIDEYHEATDDDMLQVLKSSQTLQEEPLLAIITTSGFSLSSVCYLQEYKFCEDILNGKMNDETYLALIWEAESDEEVNHPELWIKSNPLLEVESQTDTMMTNLKNDVNTAIQKNELNNVLVKNFNMWTQSTEASFIDAKSWNQCAVDKKPDIKDKEVFIGLDLSRVNDLSAISWLIPLDDEKFFVDTFTFVGSREDMNVKSKRDGFDYRQLEKQGYCKIATTESGYIDYEEIVPFIVNFIEENDLKCKGIFYDQYSATTFITKMEKDYPQYPLINVRQGYITLSQPTKDLIRRIHEGSVVHNNNPFLTVAAFNAVTKTNNDLIMIDKETYRNKIDSLAALINAHTEAMHYDFNPIDYEEYYKNIEF